MKKDVKFIYVPIKDVKPADYNPRNISDEGLDGLMESIKEFGIEASPLVINTTTGNLVSGHQRLKAAHKLGLKEVPVIYLELTEVQERALNVTLNNPRIQGFFTDDLQAMLAELDSDLGEMYKKLKLDQLEVSDEWNSDIDAINKVEENLDGIAAKITITCPQDLKDEVLIYLKAKLMETSFEGVHIE